MMKIATIALVVCAYAWADSGAGSRAKPKDKRFGLRLLYQPSYRFLSPEMIDIGERELVEVKQFYPSGGGIEGEAMITDLLFVAAGGCYTYASPVFALKDERLQADMVWESSGYDLNFWSGVFYKVRGHFKAGGGMDLSRYKLHIWVGDAGEQKTDDMKFGWYTLSIRLSLRKDFRFTYGGFGLGLNAVVPVTKPFGKKITVSGSGEDDETELASSYEENPFSYILMPTLYFTL